MNLVNPLARYLLVVPLVVATTLLSGCERSISAENEQPYIHSATVATYSRDDSYEIARQYIGKIAAKQQTQLSFEYPGRVINIFVDSGDQVKKGQVLAKLDVELLNIRVAELAAQVQQVEAQLVLNQSNLKRAQKLIVDDYASEQTIDELNAEQSVLNANLAGLKASLAALQYQIKQASLTAPYDGIVNDRMISVGDLVAAGNTAMTLIKQSQQEISFGIPAQIASDIQIGDKLPVSLGTKHVDATVSAIGQQIDPGTRTVNVRMLVDDQDKQISGVIARVSIEQRIERPGYWLPITAITDGIRGQWNIYLVTESQGQFKITPQTINVLHTTTDQVFVAGPTSNDLTVISEGLHRYVPGQIIRPAKGGAE
ncbi:efflux RND transporter periplasmic adaptor subunit [Thalassotalea euphylliae]|uniref:efflux RND transporter periplasmic adaptor subunit n=1 Tax=Thalassotalea euphylliae TaxID=1655234 RepID=UPI00362D0BED